MYFRSFLCLKTKYSNESTKIRQETSRQNGKAILTARFLALKKLCFFQRQETSHQAKLIGVEPNEVMVQLFRIRQAKQYKIKMSTFILKML